VLQKPPDKLNGLDGWIRNRLRYCIWHHWKKPERKRENLIRLGVDQGDAYAWSRTRKGGWAVAQSPILGTTITLERLKKRGYVSLLDIYKRISPKLNEPLYTRSIQPVPLSGIQWCERCTSGLLAHWPSTQLCFRAIYSYVYLFLLIIFLISFFETFTFNFLIVSS